MDRDIMLGCLLLTPERIVPTRIETANTSKVPPSIKYHFEFEIVSGDTLASARGGSCACEGVSAVANEAIATLEFSDSAGTTLLCLRGGDCSEE